MNPIFFSSVFDADFFCPCGRLEYFKEYNTVSSLVNVCAPPTSKTEVAPPLTPPCVSSPLCYPPRPRPKGRGQCRA